MNSEQYRGTMRPYEVNPLIPALPAFASVGVGRTRAYELLNSGVVPAVKLGRSTMIRSADWQNYLNSLPSYRSSHEKVAA